MTDPHGPPDVAIVEVAPRDGLQNFEREVPAETKIAFIDDLARSGLRAIEACSFVHPAAVPKMADAAEVMRGIERVPGIRYIALVPNRRGLDRALAAEVDSIALFAAATEAFSQANLNASIQEAQDRFSVVAETAKSNGMWIRGYVSVAFHCPYSGAVDPDAVIQAVRFFAQLGCDELALADTTGHATPEDVRRLLLAVSDSVPIESIAMHVHDTHGHALENVATGYQMGVRIFDSSAGGIGGCPFSPGAKGNVATENVVAFFDSIGVRTGVSAIAVTEAYSRHLGRLPAT
jgi:hydroxymethylglutaryl-CoA lyase